jgi:hypothetical protein
LDDAAPLATEHLREKPLATGQPDGSNNEQWSFQNADDRQQRNQERQQQALFLRRQLRNLNTDSFDMRSLLDGGGTLQQQGATR